MDSSPATRAMAEADHSKSLPLAKRHPFGQALNQLPLRVVRSESGQPQGRVLRSNAQGAVELEILRTRRDGSCKRMARERVQDIYNSITC